MSENSPITNTTKKVREDPMGKLVEHAVLGTSHAIEADERRGQAELIQASQSAETTRLPAEMRGPREEYEQLGIELGDPDPDDPLWLRAKLPDGWSVEPGENPYGYWSFVVDANGYRRVAIFYKAAFYDRHAAMHLERCPATSAQSRAADEIHVSLPEGGRSDGPLWRGGDGIPGYESKLDEDGNYLCCFLLARYEPFGVYHVHSVRRATIAADGEVLVDELKELPTPQVVTRPV